MMQYYGIVSFNHIEHIFLFFPEKKKTEKDDKNLELS